jgi:anti-sigma factor RsiW
MDAYMDDELELSRQLSLEQHLKSCASCTSLLQSRRHLQKAFRSTSLKYAAPESLKTELLQRLQRSHVETERVTPKFLGLFALQNWWGGFMAATVCTSLLFTSVPYAGRLSRTNRLAQEVTNSHVHALMAHHLMDVESTNQHNVKPWFNGRTDFAPSVQNFADQGFPLAGGRLDYLDRRTVAALVYHRGLHPINVYTWPSPSATESNFRTYLRQGYHLVHWSHRGMDYWVISDLNEHELQDFSELVRNQ